MPIPEFVAALRARVGRAELWLPGVTAVVTRGDEVLLVRRSDTGRWAPIGGIVEPGEEPAVAARREALEETGVEIRVDRLASVGVIPRVTYPNGDRAVYLDHTFACTWVSGEAHVADDESTAVGWFTRDRLPELTTSAATRIQDALTADTVTRFRR